MKPDDRYDMTLREREIALWNLLRWERKLAIESAVFKEFIRDTLVQDPSNPCFSLSNLWEAAHEPAALEPKVWFEGTYQHRGDENTIFEVDGRGIIRADPVTAAWYAHDLDPRFGIPQLMEILNELSQPG